jgi:hypothetical protein
LLGGDVPDPTNPSNIHFHLGVLTEWLEKTKNSKEKELLILENIDKMDIGAVSVLNNFLQDLKKGSLFVNGDEYRMPEKGMMLLVAREEVNWSAAENSRPVYLRVEDDRSFATRAVDLIQEFFLKDNFKRIDERFQCFELDIRSLISSFFLQSIKDPSNPQTFLQNFNLTHFL